MASSLCFFSYLLKIFEEVVASQARYIRSLNQNKGMEIFKFCFTCIMAFLTISAFKNLKRIFEVPISVFNKHKRIFEELICVFNKLKRIFEELISVFNKLKRIFEEVNNGKEDVETKMIPPEKRQGKEVELENEVGERVAEKIQDTETYPARISTGTVKRNCMRNDNVSRKVLYGIGAIDGVNTITNCFKNIESMKVATGNLNVPKNTSTGTVERNDDVSTKVVYGIGGINGDSNITRSFQDIGSMAVATGNLSL